MDDAITAEELDRLLEQIDASLELRPVATEAAEGLPEAVDPARIPSIFRLRRNLEAIMAQRAPFFNHTGRIGSKISWVLNLPLRVFGRKQYLHNQFTLLLLEMILNDLEQIHWSHGFIERKQRLNALERQVSGQREWLRLVERKLQRLSMDWREEAPAGSASPPEPRILDQEAYARKLAGMTSGVCVNMGCGERPLEDYINADCRSLPGVDVVADVRWLPFEDGSVAELASYHLVEHFREHDLRKNILPYWRSLLRPGGRLRTVCPNWGAMIARLHDGRMSAADFRTLTFGAQDYEGDDHFAMYAPRELTALLLGCGFKRVDTVVEERMNGICPEMEILAHV